MDYKIINSRFREAIEEFKETIKNGMTPVPNEVHVPLSGIGAARPQLVNKIKDGALVDAYIKVVQGRVYVFYPTERERVGWLAESKDELYKHFESTTPATNIVCPAEDIVTLTNDKELIKCNVYQSPAWKSKIIVKIPFENLISTVAENNTGSNVVSGSSVISETNYKKILEDAHIPEHLRDKIEVRMNYIGGLGFSSKVRANVMKNFVSWFSNHQDVEDFCPCFTNMHGEVEQGIKHVLMGENIKLVGPKGTGKNTYVKHLSSLFNIPMYDFQCGRSTDKTDLIGSRTIVDNSAEMSEIENDIELLTMLMNTSEEEFKKNEFVATLNNLIMHFKKSGKSNERILMEISDFLVHLRDGGFQVVDEGNMLRPEEAAMLHSALDERKSVDVPGYGVVKVHPQSIVFITMNEGDEYTGTKEPNAAFMDRFHEIRFVPDVDSMSKVFEKRCGLAAEDAEHLCKFYKIIHSEVYNEDSEIPEEILSQRKFIRAGKLYANGFFDSIADAVQAECIDTIGDELYRTTIEGLMAVLLI
jgi:MoxR-like ATPase